METDNRNFVINGYAFSIEADETLNFFGYSLHTKELPETGTREEVAFAMTAYLAAKRMYQAFKAADEMHRAEALLQGTQNRPDRHELRSRLMRSMYDAFCDSSPNAVETTFNEWLERAAEYEREAVPDLLEISGYVYLLKSPSGFWKIGKTVNPADRIKTFSVKLPFEVEFECLIETNDHHRLETELHDKFANKRANGSEFFSLSNEDVLYIKSLSLEGVYYD